MELAKDVDGNETLAHLSFNIPEYYEGTKRELVVKLADASSEQWSSSDVYHQSTHRLASMAFTAPRIRFDRLLTPNLSTPSQTPSFLAPVLADLNVYFDWYLCFK
jgi:hypothetical protein